MSTLHQQVNRARNRLWFNLWHDLFYRSLTWAAGLFALMVLIFRAAGWPAPWLPIAGAFLAIVLLVSLVWSIQRRPSDLEASAALDAAAGLRERISSGLACETMDDPFAKAVCADAESRAASLTVRSHLRMRWPESAARAGGALVVAAMMFLVPYGMFAPEEAKAEQREEVRLTRTRVEVKKRLEEIKKMAQTNPALSDLKDELEKLDTMPKQQMDRPDDVRQEALKRIDKLADAVKEKQQSEKFDKVSETKRMMRALEQPEGPKTPVQKLAKNLATGDFKAAQETISEIKEQLATLKQEGDKELVQQMEKQLEQLAEQLDKIASQEQLQKKLEQAGIKKEDVERMLQQLTKEDLDQLKKQLEKSGMSQKQIEQMAQQMQKQQGACQAMKQMSQAMQNAAQSAGSEQMGDAMTSMEQASDQLSEMEMLEQEMNQLESSLSDLQNARNQMGDQCKQCNGSGQQNGKPCSGCNGSGMGDQDGDQQGQGGMGRLGQGRGGLAPSSPTDVGFKVERGKVETTKGKIIGQFLVDGEQVKGESNEEFVETIGAAVREATDAVNRDRIPRQYQKIVREYFSRLPQDLGVTVDDSELEQDGAAEEAETEETDAPAEESE